MVLATATKIGRPWAAVVFYAYDESYNFYFISVIDSLDMKHELASLTIYYFNPKTFCDFHLFFIARYKIASFL